MAPARRAPPEKAAANHPLTLLLLPCLSWSLDAEIRGGGSGLPGGPPCPLGPKLSLSPLRETEAEGR